MPTPNRPPQPVTRRVLASKSRIPALPSHKTRSTPSFPRSEVTESSRFPLHPSPAPAPPHPTLPGFHQSRYFCPHVLNCGPKLPPAGHSRVFVVPLLSPPKKKDTALSVFGIYAPLLISAIQPVSPCLCFPFGHLDGDPPANRVLRAMDSTRAACDTHSVFFFFFKPPRTKTSQAGRLGRG